MAFYYGCTFKNDSSIIKCANCFFLYVRHFKGTKQKPHDHLFKKPWQQWTRSFESNNDENRITRCFTVAVQLKNDSRVIKYANCFFLFVTHYNGIKQKPHDHLFQSRGNGGPGVLHRIMIKI